MAALFSFAPAPERRDIWSFLADDIHTAVFDHVGVEKVRVIIRNWAADFNRREAKISKAQDKLRRKAKELIGTAQERHTRRGEGFTVYPFPPDPLPDGTCPEVRTVGSHFPPDPEWPLPLPHHKLNELEEWAILSAIHDYYRPGEKINPWPLEKWDQPACTDHEVGRQRAEALEGWVYWKLIASVDRLTVDNESVVKNWLGKLAPPPPAADEDLNQDGGGGDDNDGPAPPDGFRWNKKTFHGLSLKPFNVLVYLWPLEGRSAQADPEMAAAVYGDREELIPDTAMDGFRSRLNKFFSGNSIPYHATLKNKFLTIADGPSQASLRAKS